MNKFYIPCLLVAASLLLGRTAAAQCPMPAGCTPGRASSPQAALAGMGIFNVTLETINNTTAGTTDGYQDYSCQQVAQLAPGGVYRVSVTTNPNTNENVRIWLDYNNNGAFDPATELFFSSSNARLHTGLSRPVPATAVAGVRLRLRVAADGATAALPTPCSTPLYSQTEDYGVVLGPPTQPPVAAFGVDAAQACTGRFAFLDQSQRSPATWRWRFGDGSTSTLPNPAHTYAAPGVYAVTLRVCNAFGCDSLTQAAAVRWYPPLGVAAQCTPATASYCCNYGIASVVVGGQTQASASAAVGYEDFTCKQRFTGVQNDVVPLRITHSNASIYDTRVYLDYDNNGVFNEATELVFEALNANSPAGSFRLAGGGAVNTPLRLRVVSAASGLPLTACTSLVFGQAEDYGFVLAPAPCVAGPPLAPLGGARAVCTGTAGFLTAPNAPGGATFQQWQTSPDSLAWTNLLGEHGDTLALAAVTAPRYYRLLAVCGGSTRATPACRVVPDPNLCYCVPAVTAQLTTCTPAAHRVLRARIAQTTFDNAAAPCAPTLAAAHHQLPPYPLTQTAVLQRGGTYALELVTTQARGVGMWLDADRNGRFEPAEYTWVPAPAAAGTPTTALFAVPAAAALGLTGLRLRTTDAPNDDACAPARTGETYDYRVTIAPPSCAAPLAGGRVLGRPTFCVGTLPPLSVLGQTIGTQLQWQIAPDSLAWADVAGATGRLLTGPGFRDSTYVRVRVRCGAAVAYTPAVYARPDVQLCFCTPPPGPCPVILTQLRIGNTPLRTLGSNCFGPTRVSYTYYPPRVAANTATLLRGLAYPVSTRSLTGLYPLQPITRLWLDYNHDGAFTEDEATVLNTRILDPTRRGIDTLTTLFVRPNAPLGQVRLRVVTAPFDSPLLSSSLVCQTVMGEVRDYLVTIAAPTPAPGAPVAGTVAAPLGQCLGQPLRLTVAGSSYGAALQWEQQVGGGPWQPLAGATDAVLLTALTAPTAYRVAATANGQTTYSAPAAVAARPCPCAPTVFGGTPCDGYIDGVAVYGPGGYLNARNGACSAAAPFSYTNYGLRNDSLHTTLWRGQSYVWSMNARSNSRVLGGVWLDYNQNGTFEPLEYIPLPTDRGFGQGVTLGVPATARLGQVAVRYRTSLALPFDNTTACSNLVGGETEDYIFTIADEPTLEAPAILFNNAAAGPPPAGGGPLTLSIPYPPAGISYRWRGPNGFASTAAQPTLATTGPANTGYYYLTAQLGAYQLTTARYLDLGRISATAGGQALPLATLFPNPSPGTTTLHLEGVPDRRVTVLVLNATGQAVWQAEAPTTGGTLDLPLQLPTQPPGLYVVRVQTAAGAVYRKWLRF